MSALVISDILGLFVNTLTVDYKNSLRSRKNLLQPIQLQLSKKQNFFLNFLLYILTSASNFEHFEKKCVPHRLCISEIRDCKRRG